LLVVGRVRCEPNTQAHLHEFTRRLLEVASGQPEVAIHDIAGTRGFGRSG
jgi:hypothetical protein